MHLQIINKKRIKPCKYISNNDATTKKWQKMIGKDNKKETTTIMKIAKKEINKYAKLKRRIKDKYYREQQSPEYHDGEEPEIEHMAMAQRIRETYIQYNTDGTKQNKFRKEYPISTNTNLERLTDVHKVLKRYKKLPLRFRRRIFIKKQNKQQEQHERNKRYAEKIINKRKLEEEQTTNKNKIRPSRKLSTFP